MLFGQVMTTRGRIQCHFVQTIGSGQTCSDKYLLLTIVAIPGETKRGFIACHSQAIVNHSTLLQ
jgi:hypothetical protein